LIVDDAQSTLSILERSLRPIGHSIFLAGTADSAIKFLKTDAIDLVLLDIELHGTMSGLDVARYIRRMAIPMPVIIVSGHTQEEVYRMARTDALAGISLFLSKPIDLKQLLTIVDRIAKP
jgi:CheY-like chemotaxis protein